MKNTNTLKLINKVNSTLLTAIQTVIEVDENTVAINGVLLDDKVEDEVKLKVLTIIKQGRTGYASGYKYISVKIDTSKSAILADIRRINMFLKNQHKKAKINYVNQHE